MSWTAPSDELLARLRILNGRDADLAADATRAANRLRDALVAISPALERAVGDKLATNPGARDGSVSAALDAGDGYTVSASQASATVSVADDDDLEFTLILNRASETDVYVVYVTIAGETTAGLDIAFDDGMITFEPGETHKTVTVTTLDDGAAESDERMALDLVWISGAELANKRAIGTITDND